jgi:hypothetical protein
MYNFVFAGYMYIERWIMLCILAVPVTIYFKKIMYKSRIFGYNNFNRRVLPPDGGMIVEGISDETS